MFLHQWNTDCSRTKPYLSLVGSLIYINITRPDVVTAVTQYVKYMYGPSEELWNTSIRVLHYHFAGLVFS